MKFFAPIIFLFLTYSCKSEKATKSEETVSAPPASFTQITTKINEIFSNFQDKPLPHNPGITAEKYSLRDLSTDEKPCKLELTMVSSSKEGEQAWVEERKYEFWIWDMDSAAIEDHLMLYFIGINAAVGEAHTEFTKREAITKPVNLFFREDIGYYMLIYTNSGDEARELARYFNRLKDLCR
jgi:hypothetical protein